MGSTWHVKLAVPRARVSDAEAQKAAIDETLERINDEMSTYRPQSEITRFNESKSTSPVHVSHELAVVVAKAIDVGHDTDGAFDITIDPLIDLWGFDRAGRRTDPPSADEIEAARAHVGLALIEADVEHDTITKHDAETRINLGGIAAGYAVDVVARELEQRGFHDAMVEITGELVARGTNAHGAPWEIGITTPDPRAMNDARDVVETVPLQDAALTTSGSYHNFFEYRGKRYSHILDPKSGAPVDADLVAVTVRASDALTADGYDTPFIIVGEERARAIVAKHAGMAAMFIHAKADGTWRITTTPGFPSAR